MDNRTVKIFFACALGAGIGSLVTLNVHYLWWVGLLSGAAIGYFFYDFREALRAFPIARRAILDTANASVFSSMFWKRIGYALPPAVAGATSFIGAGLLLDIFAHINGGHDPHLLRTVGFVLGALGGGFIFLFLSLGILPIYISDSRKGIRFIAALTIRLAPPISYAIALYAIWRWLMEVVNEILGIARFCRVFTKTLFLIIHSDIRLLCGVDSAIGALIGFFFGSPAIGALAGAAIGVGNYKLISQRLLHLHKPRQTA